MSQRPLSSLASLPVNPPDPLAVTSTPATGLPSLRMNPKIVSPSALAGPAPRPRTSAVPPNSMASATATFLRTRAPPLVGARAMDHMLIAEHSVSALRREEKPRGKLSSPQHDLHQERRDDHGGQQVTHGDRLDLHQSQRHPGEEQPARGRERQQVRIGQQA